MGHDRAVPVTVEMFTTGDTSSRYCTPAEWRTKARVNAPAHGKPTDANLKLYVEMFEASTQPGGCNAHLGATVVFSAKITDHRSGVTKATYRGPSFVVV